MGQSLLVSANTEIVNFGVAPSVDVPLPQSPAWRRLSPNEPEQLFNVFPAPLGTALEDVCEPEAESSFGDCPHELWLSIGTEDPAWAAYSKFTLRVSWPASSPADFYLNTYSPESLGQLVYGRNMAMPGGALTRRTYARIRVISSGVLTPSHAHRHLTLDPVSFMVAVEPLYLGVLPTSVVPTILAIVAVTTLAGWLVVPFITEHLMAIAGQIKAEIPSGSDRKSQ
ncbi:hypothetical protein DICSQDRAFT_47923 [Dichomitus squalens LYAD-421 SS1]|uniref:uncharacterized protein n=1 Tax=Dichomitus squalens (strain LYAD-421) TaxID=732165 RepID=UPI0004412523|nr:uncharacterized protein DICSQDRAFT_47923 [Dichomitus squalens LYAD-421 SS1]EJF67388.1 hypothetical protein DICSQDRAFT_47923 [Dichomitus squalens LYAD-421 SS1]